MQFLFYVTALRLINQLDSWKIIVNDLYTYAEKMDTITKKYIFLKQYIGKNWNSFKKFVKKPH